MEQMLGNVVEAVLPYVKDEVRFELLLTILHLHMSHCCSEGMIETVKIELRQPAQVFIWVINDVTQKPLPGACPHSFHAIVKVKHHVEMKL